VRTDDEPGSRWTTDDVVTWLATQGRRLSAVTWRAYVSRGQAPAATYTGRTPTWAPAEVAEWHRTRTRTAPPAGEPAPVEPPTREQITALRAEADRLFAEQQAIVEEVRPRELARDEQLDETMRRQEQANEAEDRAWEALEAARAAQRADPTLIAAVDQAEAAYADAQAHCLAEYQAVRDIQRRLMDEMYEDHDRISRAGQAFRAAQDAAIEAEMRAQNAAPPDGR
jgi:hypothetical protein